MPAYPRSNHWQRGHFLAIFLLLPACSNQPGLPQQPARHLEASGPPSSQPPSPVTLLPAPPQPRSLPEQANYSISVSKLGINELLFALARDAKLNLDLHGGISGEVTLNAIEQTLPQILWRISQQVDIRWQLNGNTLTVRPDTPYLKTYRIDYFNIARDIKSTVSIANAVESGSGSPSLNHFGGSGGNTSSTVIESEIQNRFWKRLESNLKELLHIRPETQPTPPPAPVYGTTTARQASQIARPAMSMSDVSAALAIAERLAKIEKNAAQAEKAASQAANLQAKKTPPSAATSAPAIENNPNQVILHPETGTLILRARHKEHQKVAEYLALIQAAALRQVLIEATVVEVALSDQYQAGVDWSLLTHSQRGSLRQSLTSTHFTPAGPVSMLGYSDKLFSATVAFLEQFGRTRVLSSPKVIALNNQTAVMKVVDQQVYFSLKITEDKNENGVVVNRTYNSEIHTVPVGLVMQVTPHIAESGNVMLSVRPTITRITGYVEDPAIAMIAADSQLGIRSLVPNLQVREFDSSLKVPSGQIAVLGGLIQDSQQNERTGMPGLSRLPLLGDLFSYRDDSIRKTELVIFLRPLALNEASLSRELSHFRQFSPGQDFFQREDDHALSAFRSGNIPLPSGQVKE